MLCKYVCTYTVIHALLQNTLSTPLHVASTYGFLDIARVLVYHGADINSKNMEQATPIHRYMPVQN